MSPQHPAPSAQPPDGAGELVTSERGALIAGKTVVTIGPVPLAPPPFPIRNTSQYQHQHQANPTQNAVDRHNLRY